MEHPTADASLPAEAEAAATAPPARSASAFAFDWHKFSLAEVKQAALNAGLPFGNHNGINALRYYMRRSGMQLAY